MMMVVQKELETKRKRVTTFQLPCSICVHSLCVCVCAMLFFILQCFLPLDITWTIYCAPLSYATFFLLQMHFKGNFPKDIYMHA